MNPEFTASTDSIEEMDDLTKWTLDCLETHLLKRRIKIGRINEMLMNIWEEDLQDEGFQFINSEQDKKKEKYEHFMEEFNKILKKIVNGGYDDDEE